MLLDGTDIAYLSRCCQGLELGMGLRLPLLHLDLGERFRVS
jgi:hypothetical protein